MTSGRSPRKLVDHWSTIESWTLPRRSDGPHRRRGGARTVGVAAGLVVSLADQLEPLGAIRRERDPNDRRRQVLTLTDRGRTLLAECTAVAHTLDAALAESLLPAARRALHQALTTLATQAGLPT